MNIVPVILSGGSGTRLWPVSRAQYPKQLIALTGRDSLLQQTVLRARRVAAGHAPIVVCNRDYRFQVAGQLQEVEAEDASILLEPCGRNTAPAIAIAALHARTLAEDPLVLVLPSDHLITNTDKFADAIEAGLSQARSGALVTFGIKPTEPATGYGYIQAAGEGVAPVTRFTEKPAREVAEKYLQAGGYYWNSGMFLFRADAYLDALNTFAPEMLAICREAFEALEQDSDFLRIPEAVFARCPADSIDYTVMEKTDKAMVVPMDAGWSDLGSWRSLWENGDKDPDGNVLRGDVLIHGTNGCYIRAETRLVAAAGVQDYVIVETADAVLVVPMDRCEDVKHLVRQLDGAGGPS